MPYAVERKGRVYQIVNTETGDVKARATTKREADKQLVRLNAIEHGWEPTSDGRYKRTVNGQEVHLTLTGGSK